MLGSLALAPATTAGAAGVVASNFATQSGSKIMSTALSAARAMGSCTATSTTTISGQVYSSVVNSATTSGQQTLHIGAAVSVVKVIHATVYLNDNAVAIESQFGVSAPTLAGRWIAIDHTNSNFARFNAGIVMASLLSEIPPAGALKTTPTLVLNHTRVIGVYGRPNIHLGLASGTETVYVALDGPHVPVEVVASDIVAGVRQTFIIHYSHWGTNFHLAAPSTSLAFRATHLPQ